MNAGSAAFVVSITEYSSAFVPDSTMRPFGQFDETGETYETCLFQRILANFLLGANKKGWSPARGAILIYLTISSRLLKA